MSEGRSVIEKSTGPNGLIIDDYLAFTIKYEDQGGSIPGDKLDFSGLKEKPGLKLISAEAQEMPPYDDRDGSVYKDIDSQFKLTIHADAGKYRRHRDNKKLFNDIKSWLMRKGHENYLEILSTEVTSTTDTNIVVCVQLLLDEYVMGDLIGNIVSSFFYDAVWNKHMNQLISEGVCYVYKSVPNTLRMSLQNDLKELSDKTPIDYHPNSNDIIRDLVHPALYPYIKGVSKMSKSCQPVTESSATESKDFWGREYEDSKFQWLPSPFKISEDKKCIIEDYINNLDRNLMPDLYSHLESLFAIFLPYFEEVWSYAKGMEFFQGDDGSEEPLDKISPLEKKSCTFKGQELQVITKIVEYKLEPGQAYEGVWHAEGMSHENIVMTGIYFLDRDQDIEGGNLKFKRAFTEAERTKVLFEVPQTRPRVCNDFAAEGFIPLGYFPTEEDYLLVFPNCHIHKISKMINKSSSKTASRRIIVFFVVNPEKKIISTREVPPQQNIISLSAAKSYRLELMAERKYDKEKLNVRDIELCEH